MRICVHNCGRPEEEWVESLRKHIPTAPGAEISSADFAKFLQVRGNDLGALEKLVDIKALESNFTPEQLAQWQIPTPELIRQLEEKGVDCDVLRMYPHEVKPLDTSNIAAQCRNDDITKCCPKTFTIKILGGNYQRLRPRYVYKGRTKRGPRRFRLQIVTRKEKACTI